MKIRKYISIFCEWSATAAIGLIGIFTFVDVLARYIFNKPFMGSNEMLEIMMALLIASSLAVATRDRSHIAVSLFEGVINANALLKKCVGFLTESISVICFAALSYWIVLNTISQFNTGMKTELLHIPVWIIGALISIYLILTTVVIFVNNIDKESQL